MSLAERENARLNGVRRTVLVVDDEPINRNLLGYMLGNDYDIVFAENGKEAWDTVCERRTELSLILLDLLMPEMDGFQVLELLKADDELRRIPVIVSTSEKKEEVKSLQMGAVDFIHKPFDAPEVIMARVRRSIELAEDASIINATETDSLTGLYIKEYFYEYSNRADRYAPDKPMDAAVVNINRFHLVNELRGRAGGNEVLRTVADYLRGAAVEAAGYACRGEADAFYLYLPHRESYEDLVGGVTAALETLIHGAHISVRVGVYSNVDKSVPIDQRFDRANLASAPLRSSYESRVAIYDEKTHERELYNERLLEEMDEALATNQFKVFYQPKYDITGDKPVLCSAEALVRWIHPELGFISPGDFIPAFEEHGLINKLDLYVWREAAAQIRRWRDKFGMTVPVSVNVSRVDLQTVNFESELVNIVKDNGISFSDLLLEITESAYTENEESIVKTVAQLRETGFKIEMDDFGSGYSSLNMLTAMPIDALKLDMRFVRHLTADSKDIRMVQLMVDIAGFLSVPVIAEGVETEEQVQLLRECGCDVVQGYYFSKPVPADDFEKFITREKE